MSIISRKGMTIAEYDEALEDGVEAVFDSPKPQNPFDVRSIEETKNKN